MNTGRYECDMSCRLGKYGFGWRGRERKFWICSTERGKESVIKRRDESQDEETDGPNDTGNRTVGRVNTEQRTDKEYCN